MQPYSRSQSSQHGLGSRSQDAIIADGETASSIVPFDRQMYAISVSCADISNIPAGATLSLKINRDGDSVMFPAMKVDADGAIVPISYTLPTQSFDLLLPDIAFVENIQLVLSIAADGGPVLFEVTGIDEGIRVG